MKTVQTFKKYFIIVTASAALFFLQACSKNNPKPVAAAAPASAAASPVPIVAIPTTANFDKLVAWNAFKNNQSSSYDLALIGDSYTQGNFYSWRLRGMLLAGGFTDGGPGYCSFGRSLPTDLSSLDGSIGPSELDLSYDPTVWTPAEANAYGPCGNVQNTTANSMINVTAKVPLQSLTIIYERHPGNGNFQYRVNGGSWTTVRAANPTQDIDSTLVDVSGAGSNVQLDINPLSANEIFCGVLARRTGSVLVVHKVGSAGETASFFAQNALWSESTQLLTPKGVVIMFGTNEMIANVPPDQMKINVQNIIDKVRAIQPNVDIMIMCPPETKYENEDPRAYKIADYGNMLYKLALANNAAFIYFPNLFGHFSQALVDNGLMSTDRIHPGDNGSLLMATTIYSALKL